MFAELTDELMDLTVTQSGCGGLYAVNEITLCCCLSTSCTCD